MSLMAIAPPGTISTGDASGSAVITNDGWFPNIDLVHMREATRLDGTVTNARLTEAAIDAMMHANRELRDWKAAQRTYTNLAAVPSEKINGESQNVALYRRAVYCTAKADLIERYRDYDSTASSLSDKKSMEWLNDAPAEQRRNAQWAVADITGRTHTTVELI